LVALDAVVHHNPARIADAVPIEEHVAEELGAGSARGVAAIEVLVVLPDRIEGANGAVEADRVVVQEQVEVGEESVRVEDVLPVVVVGSDEAVRLASAAIPVVVRSAVYDLGGSLRTGWVPNWPSFPRLSAGRCWPLP